MGTEFCGFKMRVVVFCLCLLGYTFISASKLSETEHDWQNDVLSNDTLELEPSQEMMKAGSNYVLTHYITGDTASAVTKQKKWFHYNNPGPLPEEARVIMLPPRVRIPARTSVPNPKVETLCHLDRMYVRIRKNAVNDTRAWRYLYFGNCRVNQARGPHYYFLYPLTRCGLRPLVKCPIFLILFVLVKILM